MTSTPAAQSPDLAFSDADFQTIARYAAQSYGLDIKIEKKGLIYARLARRIRALGMSDFSSYCAFATGRNAGAEREELLSALTTNVSSFYRERHHFQMLRDTVLPDLRRKAETGGLRIWSAGCSAGQEPYTIAATICDLWPDAGQLNIQIIATDVDPHILEKARAARYRTTETDGLTPQQQAGLFDPLPKGADTRDVRGALRKMVTFDRINLVGDWSFPQRYDIIFCRNVVIYFERATQHQLWRRFSDSLVPGGRLFIGHSERLSGPAASQFQNVGITAFIKSGP